MTLADSDGRQLSLVTRDANAPVKPAESVFVADSGPRQLRSWRREESDSRKNDSVAVGSRKAWILGLASQSAAHRRQPMA